jgi:hypothetical protein
MSPPCASSSRKCWFCTCDATAAAAAASRDWLESTGAALGWGSRWESVSGAASFPSSRAISSFSRKFSSLSVCTAISSATTFSCCRPRERSAARRFASRRTGSTVFLRRDGGSGVAGGITGCSSTGGGGASGGASNAASCSEGSGVSEEGVGAHQFAAPSLVLAPSRWSALLSRMRRSVMSE